MTVLTKIHRNFSDNRLLHILFAIFAGVWVWAAIDPVYRFDWFLENILTIFFIGIVIATYSRFPFSQASYIQIFIFAVLHTIGGHFTYSEVPLGFWLQDMFNFSRNHYDRIVHFAFGLLLVYPFREIFLRRVSDKRFFSSLFALTLVFTVSGSFEIIEWMVAIVVDPKAGAAYLGTQGDEFDSQKDMALAFGGALIALALIALVSTGPRSKRF